MPTHLWLFGLLRMVDIYFYFECKGNVFGAGMQSSFWFIFVLLGGGFYAHPFLAGGDACFYQGGGWHLPTSRAHLACVRGGGGNACAHGYVSGEYTKKA